MKPLLVVVSLVWAVACGGGNKSATQEPAPPPPASDPVIANQEPAAEPPPAEPTQNERAMQVMQRFMNDMCACQDADCAKQVSDAMTQWGMEMAKQQRDKEPPKMTEEEQNAFVEIGTRMGECMQKAMGFNP